MDFGSSINSLTKRFILLFVSYYSVLLYTVIDDICAFFQLPSEYEATLSIPATEDSRELWLEEITASHVYAFFT